MASSNSQPLEILILGAGITGLSTALALTKYFPTSHTPKIIVLEIRPVPSTIGGAINLTPSALRYLHHLNVLSIIKANNWGAKVETIDLFNVYSGASIGAIDFRSPAGDGFGDPPFKACRLQRGELLKALLEAVAKCPNIEVRFNIKTTAIKETADAVTLTVENEITLSADLLLGADGIHSVARTLHIEPTRKPIYTGIAVAMSSAPIPAPATPTTTTGLAFKDTALYSARRGSLMLSFFEPTRAKMYMAGVMQTAEVQSREGWSAKGKAQDEVRRDIRERFETVAVPELRGLIEGVEEWFLYPVYSLPAKGKWASGRAVLLGDAAHAMPPQGESTGIALEDSIIFSRTLALYPTHPSLPDLFATYESLRRARIDAAYDEAVFRWDTAKDSGWFVYKLKTWMTPWFIWWTAKARAKGFEEDLGEVKIKVLSAKSSSA